MIKRFIFNRLLQIVQCCRLKDAQFDFNDTIARYNVTTCHYATFNKREKNYVNLNYNRKYKAGLDDIPVCCKCYTSQVNCSAKIDNVVVILQAPFTPYGC